MEYKMQFGSINAKQKTNTNSKVFRIAVLGDFSGKGNSGRVEIGDALLARKPLRVTHENLDSILARLDVHLKLPAGASGAMIDVPIKQLDDFHPDQLFANVPLFEKLVSLRKKLQDSATFDKAAAAVRSLAGSGAVSTIPAARAKSQSNSVPRGRIESFADLIQSDTRENVEPELKTLMRDVVSQHVVPEMHGQAELIAAVDESLSDLMRKLLHHPDFQALESLWRSLDMLIHRLELDHELEVVLYDINASEFAADLAAVDALENSGIYKWLIDAPSMDAAQGALSMLVCNFVFEQIPPHAELLARAAKIGAAANAPIIAAVDCSFLKKTAPEDLHPLIVESWNSLRQLPESAYLALTTPRFMLRWPFGKKTEPINSFKFEEFTPRSGLSGMLWGNAAFIAGLVIAQTFRDQGLASMNLGSILTVGDIPFYFYTDADGDQVALPCTERLVNVRTAQHVTSQGLIPTISMQGSPDVRLGGLHSIAGVPLAGAWAPVSINSQSDLKPISEQPSFATPANQPEMTETPSSSPSADDDLDNLLASLDAPNEPSTDSGLDADLEALLADL